jgi:hypothetical protein
MPAQPTAAQSRASRLNGQRSLGPVSEAGKARAARNATRHGLCADTFHLLPDEDPEEHAAHEAMWLHTLNPTDLPERDAALAVVRARWRERRADRLEAQILADLFAADDLPDEAERRAVKAERMKALSTLIRYRHRIQRDHDLALAALEALRQRPQLPDEPEPVLRSEPEPVARRMAIVPSEPEPLGPLTRQQRRRREAQARKAGKRAA